MAYRVSQQVKAFSVRSLSKRVGTQRYDSQNVYGHEMDVEDMCVMLEAVMRCQFSRPGPRAEYSTSPPHIMPTITTTTTMRHFHANSIK
jgi:hypothetical protein